MEQKITNIANKVGVALLKKKYTIAVAESVTSGNLQVAFSLAKNAILFYQGGITVYNIGQKCRHLSVEPTHAIDSNCVSKKISDQMALAVAEMFSSDIGVGITGYASSVPEQNVNKLFAYLSVSIRKKIVLSKKLNAPAEAPNKVQFFYTENTLRLLVEVLKI